MGKWLYYGYRASWENRWCRSGFHGNRLWAEDSVANDSLELARSWEWGRQGRAKWDCKAAESQASLGQESVKLGWTFREKWSKARGLGPPVILCSLAGRKHHLFPEGTLLHAAKTRSTYSWRVDLGGSRLAHQALGFQSVFPWYHVSPLTKNGPVDIFRLLI